MKQKWALVLTTENHRTSRLSPSDLRVALLFWLGDGIEQPPYEFDLQKVEDIHCVEAD
jgi:hypothetical protein